MSDFATKPFTTNPWTTTPFTANPWVSDDALFFTNTVASLDPYIEVTGTPEILWTWSDGSTSSVANPGVKNLTGTHSLLVTPWSAVTRIDFYDRDLTGTFITQEWTGIIKILVNQNYFSGDFTTYEWPNLTYMTLYSNSFSGGFITKEWANITKLSLDRNSFSGNFTIQAWTKIVALNLYDNSFSSLSGSFQTQVKMTLCYLYGNSISSQVEIDKIYSDFLINAADAGRSDVCAVNTSGASMAAPSAAGLADIDDLVNIHGWTVTHA